VVLEWLEAYLKAPKIEKTYKHCYIDSNVSVCKKKAETFFFSELLRYEDALMFVLFIPKIRN
jgi:disulfide oxidoreductase YuzD